MPKPNFKNPIRKKRKERFQDLINARKNVKAKETALIEDYHKKFPKRNVYVFSSLTECATLDKLKYLKRIKVKEDKFLNSELTAKDFAESLTIFDDCDVISNKPVKKKIFDVLNSILETGRHFKCSVVFTSHNANMGLDTKKF